MSRSAGNTARGKGDLENVVNWICSHCGEKFSRFRTRCPHEGGKVIEDLAGQLIGGRYRIRELIGVGGMDSSVWKAWQTGTERTVAVKILPPADDAAAKRFARGARIAANLNHPNCLVIHDYGKAEDGKLYLVMEYLQGQVLQDLLAAGAATMPVGDVVHVAVQVLQALEHAHAERAVHRDLKPDNLFLTRRNDDPLHVKILDFGIAKYVEEDPVDAASDSDDKAQDQDGFEDQVTEQRQVCGTPQYMAPEQVVGARIDQRTDLYALGCVMYRMLTGRLPFDGKTRYELYQKHLQEAPKSFQAVRPDLAFPDRLELIVQKALMKRPDQRFPTAAEMRKALESLELGEDRARKNNRPRVALKDTSPQQPYGGKLPNDPPPLRPRTDIDDVSPTVLPPSFDHVGPGAAPYTLSVPAVPQSVANAAQDQPQVVPPPLPAPPPLPKPLGAAIGPPPLPSTTSLGLDGVSGRAGNTAVQPAAPAPTEAPRTAAARVSTDLLNDAVLRHPPSRVTAPVAPRKTASAGLPSQSLPRPTETSPNKSEEARESRRKKLTVAAVLTGAFGLGVGGVALVMKLTQGAPAAGPKAEPQPVVAAVATPATPAKPDPGHVVALPEPTPKVGATQPAKPAPKPTEPVLPPSPVPVDVTATATVAGTSVGKALGEVPLVPSRPANIEVQLTSDPPGALVKEGENVLGTTPATLWLAPGKHQLALERVGSKPMPLALDLSGLGPVLQKVVLEPLPRAPLAPPPGGGTRPIVKPTTGELVSKPEPVVESKPPLTIEKLTNPQGGEEGKKPTVKLLDDGEPPATPPKTPPKNPNVKLLEDGDDKPPPAPKVKVLDE